MVKVFYCALMVFADAAGRTTPAACDSDRMPLASLLVGASQDGTTTDAGSETPSTS